MDKLTLEQEFLIEITQKTLQLSTKKEVIEFAINILKEHLFYENKVKNLTKYENFKFLKEI